MSSLYEGQTLTRFKFMTDTTFKELILGRFQEQTVLLLLNGFDFQMRPEFSQLDKALKDDFQFKYQDVLACLSGFTLAVVGQVFALELRLTLLYKAIQSYVSVAQGLRVPGTSMGPFELRRKQLVVSGLTYLENLGVVGV